MERRVVFKGKAFEDILQDIYENSTGRRSEIATLINSLKDFMKDRRDAAAIAPIIKDLLEVSVHNDDQLVKLATIVQRIIIAENKGSGGGDSVLTDEEYNELIKAAEDIAGDLTLKERAGTDLDEIKTRAKEFGVKI